MAGWTHLKGNGRGNGEHNEIPGERERPGAIASGTAKKDNLLTDRLSLECLCSSGGPDPARTSLADGERSIFSSGWGGKSPRPGREETFIHQQAPDKPSLLPRREWPVNTTQRTPPDGRGVNVFPSSGRGHSFIGDGQL